MFNFKPVIIKTNNKFNIFDFNLFECPDKSICVSEFNIKINNFTYKYKGLRGGIWFPNINDKLFLGLESEELKLFKLDSDIYANFEMYTDFINKYGLTKNVNEEIGLFIWTVNNDVYFLKDEN